MNSSQKPISKDKKITDAKRYADRYDQPELIPEQIPNFYRNGFIHSRRCGTTEFQCPSKQGPLPTDPTLPTECSSCSVTGYTNEIDITGRGYDTRDNKIFEDLTEEECLDACDNSLDCIAAMYQRNYKRCQLKRTITSTGSVRGFSLHQK